MTLTILTPEMSRLAVTDWVTYQNLLRLCLQLWVSPALSRIMIIWYKLGGCSCCFYDGRVGKARVVMNTTTRPPIPRSDTFFANTPSRDLIHYARESVRA